MDIAVPTAAPDLRISRWRSWPRPKTVSGAGFGLQLSVSCNILQSVVNRRGHSFFAAFLFIRSTTGRRAYSARTTAPRARAGGRLHLPGPLCQSVHSCVTDNCPAPHAGYDSLSLLCTYAEGRHCAMYYRRQKFRDFSLSMRDRCMQARWAG